MIDISKVFGNLPSMPPTEQKGFWEKAKEWVKQRMGLQRVLQATPAEVAPAVYAAMMGRTLRSPRMWHVNWEVLRRMQFTHAVHTIVSTAVRELSGLNWTLETRSTRPGILRKAEELRDFLSRPVPGVDGLTFPEWLKLLLRDLFVYDAAAIEVIRDDSGKPLALKPVPGWQIEARALPHSADLDPEEPYWRVLYGQTIARYKVGELIYIKENLRTDSPYGISPLEAAFTIITILLWADALNLKNMSLSEIPEGIIDLGQVSPQEVERFRLYWLTEIINNPDRVVITSSGAQGIKWIPFRPDNRHLQMRQMYDWYLRLLVACFGLRPQDIGLTEGLNRAIAEEMAQAGKRFGLWPRAMLLKETINHDIIEEVFEVDLSDIQFKWLDLERRDLETSSRIIRTLAPTFMTINEARQMIGLPRIVGPLGDTLYYQAGAAIFVLGVVPSDENKDIVDKWREKQPTVLGLYQGEPVEDTQGQEGVGGLGGFGGLGNFLGLFGGQGAPAGAEQETAEKEAQVNFWQNFGTKIVPIEKAVTLALMKAKERRLPEGAWGKLARALMAARLPVYNITLLWQGREVTSDNDWLQFLESVGALEQEVGMETLWNMVWKGILEVDARKAVINATPNKVTFSLQGRRLERVLELDIKGDGNAPSEV